MEHHLNKAKSFDTEAPFMGFEIIDIKYYISFKDHDKPNGFDLS